MNVVFKPNGERWEIFVDGEKWREVHRTIFGKKPRFPSHFSNLDETFDAYEYQRVRGYVLWRLSRQSYHSEQLAKLLRERLVQQKTIDRVFHDLKGFLNDQAWIQAFIKKEQKKSGRGLILAKLRAKGLNVENLDLKPEEEEVQAIVRLIQTKYRSKERQKVIQALMRKGFQFEQIKSALAVVMQEHSLY